MLHFCAMSHYCEHGLLVTSISPDADISVFLMKILMKSFSQDYFEIVREKEKTHKKCLAQTHNQRGERGDSERQNMSKVSSDLSILLQSEKVSSNEDL